MELTPVIQFVFTTLFALIVFFSHPPQENHIANGDYYYRALDNESAQKEYELASMILLRVMFPCFIWCAYITTMEELTFIKTHSRLEYKKAVMFQTLLYTIFRIVQQHISGTHYQKEALFHLLVSGKK